MAELCSEMHIKKTEDWYHRGTFQKFWCFVLIYAQPLTHVTMATRVMYLPLGRLQKIKEYFVVRCSHQNGSRNSFIKCFYSKVLKKSPEERNYKQRKYRQGDVQSIPQLIKSQVRQFKLSQEPGQLRQCMLVLLLCRCSEAGLLAAISDSSL